LLVTGFLTASAHASIPHGTRYGPWHVVSIGSMSGTGGNDASVLITQEIDGDDLTVRWQEGGQIILSVNIDHCSADEDFDQSYAIPIETWQVLPHRAIAHHLQITFSTWIEQARLSCPKQTSIAKFQLGLLSRASRDFNQRLDYLHPRSHSTTALPK
jgi:hypothetical protein